MPPPPPIDLPNERPSIQKWRVIVSGLLLQWFIAFISMPITKLPVRNRIKVKIDTGKTGKCRMCIYLPPKEKGLQKERLEARGVLVHLHGGGWTICQPETETALCRFMCEKLGIIVVAPDYAKAPLHPYPQALEQMYNVLTWISSGGLEQTLHKHGFHTPFNSKRIALSGGSSGSNLAASLTLLTIERPLPDNACVAGAGLLYPVLNIAVPYEEKLARVDPNRVLPSGMSKLFLKAYLPPPRNFADPYVSPALAPADQLAKFPPTVILTAEYDYLAVEAEEFAKTLSDLGVRVEHKRFAHVGHAFDGMPARNKKQRKLNHGAREEAWGMLGHVFAEVLKDENVDIKEVTRRVEQNMNCSYHSLLGNDSADEVGELTSVMTSPEGESAPLN
ncbi:hypothetical protein M422DRAFT_45058 [Sphaerobolus stellatus SS14]|nr:hypothetical protein M422DRAFT_45058 [Sphaerobolus stellatus SS14]